MDPFTFVAKLVEVLAWPLSSIALIALLRREIRRLIPLLKRVKAGPLEAEFEREIKELRTEADVQFSEITQGLQAPSEVDVLFKLAPISPRSAVLEAWQQIEAAVLRVPARHSFNLSAAQSNSPATIARLLSGHGLISAEEFALFHQLRALRNQVANARQFNPTVHAALDYIGLSAKLLVALKQWPLTAPACPPAHTRRANLGLPLVPKSDLMGSPGDEVLAPAGGGAPR